MEPLVQFTPADAIHFTPSAESTYRAELQLTNLTSSNVVVKVRTNARDRYTVKPHIVWLQPGDKSRSIVFTVLAEHVRAFREDIVRQAQEGKRHTVFKMLAYDVPEQQASQWEGLSASAVSTEMQSFWRARENNDKASGVSTYQSKNYPAVCEEIEATVVSAPAPAPAKAPAPAPAVAAPAPAPAPAPASAPAAPASAAGFTVEEAMRLREEVRTHRTSALALETRCNALEMAKVRLTSETESQRSVIAQLEAELEALRRAAAAAASGAAPAAPAAEASASAKGADADAAAAGAGKFPLWQLVLVAVIAFLIGRLLSGSA